MTSGDVFTGGGESSASALFLSIWLSRWRRPIETGAPVSGGTDVEVGEVASRRGTQTAGRLRRYDELTEDIAIANSCDRFRHFGKSVGSVNRNAELAG